MSDECQTNVRKERFIAGKHMKGAGIYVAQFYVVRGCTPLSPDNYLVEYLLISPWSIYKTPSQLYGPEDCKRERGVACHGTGKPPNSSLWAALPDDCTLFDACR